MAESYVGFTAGAGGKLHSFTRTIGANTVDEETMLLGEVYLPSYTVASSSIPTTTANSHMLEIMAGSSNIVRIRKILVTQNGAPSGVSAFPLQLFRLTTAGTGGSVISPNAMAPSDGAAGATCMGLPTVKGTEGVLLWAETIWLGTAAIPVATNRLLWQQELHFKPFSIAAGTSNGICVKNSGGLATSTLDITVIFSESSFA